MAPRRLSPWLTAGALALGLLTAPTATAAAQQGTISGRVTEAGTGQPIIEARVIVIGTTLFARTNPDGRYTIRGVPPGPTSVRVVRVGFSEQRRSVTVAPGETVTLDVAMAEAVVRLQEVVTTATGEVRRVEHGNAITAIDATNVTQTQAVSNVADVLTARAPGVHVTGSSMTGGGARVRIRGANSLSLANDPIYIIDGVRMTSNVESITFGTGGTSPSRVGDINPEEIENIEIVKGPSAATLYGTDAANGVVVITTRRGRAGAARWTAYAEGGIVDDNNDYPTNYTLAGRNPSTSAYIEGSNCTLSHVSSGRCVADSVRSLNVFNDPEVSPLRLGYRNQYGLQVSGGTEAVRYWVGGEVEGESGTLGLPAFERRRFQTQNIPIRDYVSQPNALERLSVRANLSAAINPKLDAQLSTNYIQVDQRFPLESNATAGIGSQAFGGPGYKENGNVAGLEAGAAPVPLRGYRAFTPGMVFQETINQRVNRFIGSSNWNWRPTSWMQNRANIGIDYSARTDDDLRRRGEGTTLAATTRLGFKGAAGTNIRNFSVDLGSTGTWQAREWLNSRTTVGVQYVNYKFDQRTGSGQDLAPGAITAGAGSNQSASESNTLSKTLGLFIEEALDIRERLFITAAVRSDQNSAFGTNFQRVLYPKLGLSWIISDEGFFPRMNWLSHLRLRSAYGASGQQPGPNDAIRFFEDVRFNVQGTDVSGVRPSTLGNPELRPERATEFEAGFESRLLGNRVNVDLTYYNKLTKDALISEVLAPSLGTGATTRRSNLGSVKNVGWEFSLTSQILNGPRVGWDAALNGSTNWNKLVSMGAVPPQVGATTRAQAGYPLFGYWQRKYTYSDANNDGFITRDELTVDDSSTFVAPSAPKHQAIVTTGLEVLGRKLRLQTLIDYKGGHYVLNGTERIRCQSRVNCIGTSLLGAPLWEQARAVALREHSSGTQFGFMEQASFIRWREASIAYTIPDRFAARFLRARGGAIAFAARNLGMIWTRYSGIDPEADADAGNAGDLPFNFQTVAPKTYYTLRLTMNF
ncbi:MAG: SusC/RagA family TonB-linked outer membrane protein [Gemmatimonadaceae bacterium]